MTTSRPAASLQISDREIADQAIRRLHEARTAKQVDFLDVFFQCCDPRSGDGTVIVIIDPSCNTRDAMAAIVQDLEIDVSFIRSVPELCLEGEPDLDPVASTNDISRIQTLMAQISEEDWARSILLPNLRIIGTYYLSKFESLHVGFRVPLPDAEQSSLACQLVQALDHKIDLLVRGQIIEVLTSHTPEDIRRQIEEITPAAAVLPKVTTSMAEELRALADRLDRAMVEGIPAGLKIIEDRWRDDNLPVGSLHFRGNRLEVTFQYRLVEEEEDEEGQGSDA
jgi:hypothetical protein